MTLSVQLNCQEHSESGLNWKRRDRQEAVDYNGERELLSGGVALLHVRN